MKYAKRIGCLILALGMMLSVTACSGAGESRGKEEKSEKSLYEQGLEVVELMGKMARSTDYLSLMGGSRAEVIELLRNAGRGSSSEPEAVYCVTMSSFAVRKLLEEEAGESVKISSTLREEMEKRAMSSIASRINAEAGQMALMSASICTAGKLFVDHEVTENMMYIYVYEDSFPAAVAFIPGEDGAVSATGVFILNEDFAEDPETYLDEYADEIDIKVEDVTP